MNRLTQSSLYTILASLFVGCLLISNIIAFKLVDVWGLTLPAAVIIFPVVYIVNDILAEIYGFQKARQVIFLGFAINLLAVIAYNIAILLKAPVWFGGDAAFTIVLSSSFRLLIASFIAYLIGTTLNSYVMVKMRKDKPAGSKGLFFRAIASTGVGEFTDALIFITIAFIGTMPINALLTMILAQAIFKTVYEIVVFPATKVIINKVSLLPNI